MFKSLFPKASLAIFLSVLVLIFGLGTPVLAHHLMEFFPMEPSPASGLLSGLLHPALGPDHLLFLLALGIVSLGQELRFRWVLALLAVGLAGSLTGLALPNSLPWAEAWIGFSLLLEALVLLNRLPKLLLIPAFAFHGYVLSTSVLGWEPTPVFFYLIGLLISQGLLLWVALKVVRNSWAQWGSTGKLRIVSGMLAGIGTSLAWSSLVP